MMDLSDLELKYWKVEKERSFFREHGIESFDNSWTVVAERRWVKYRKQHKFILPCPIYETHSDPATVASMISLGQQSLM